jgi:hypothetical protein
MKKFEVKGISSPKLENDHNFGRNKQRINRIYELYLIGQQSLIR